MIKRDVATLVSLNFSKYAAKIIVFSKIAMIFKIVFYMFK